MTKCSPIDEPEKVTALKVDQLTKEIGLHLRDPKSRAEMLAGAHAQLFIEGEMREIDNLFAMGCFLCTVRRLVVYLGRPDGHSLIHRGKHKKTKLMTHVSARTDTGRRLQKSKARLTRVTLL